MKKKLIFTPIFILSLTLGLIITARASTPTGIQYDPADKGYCEAYGIEFDATQVEAIYLHPEIILANPEAFLNRDLASLMLAQRHTDSNDPLNVEHWIRQIEKITSLPMDEREQQISYQFSREIIAGKETFCKIAVPHIRSYLPEKAEINTTYYQAALDPINTGFYIRGGIVTGLGHPLYEYAEKLLSQGSAPIYNNMTHELFHRGYSDAWLWQVEPPLENTALRALIRNLQEEGMAVNAAYQIMEYYPSSLDIVYPLHNFQPYVRYWLRQVNKVFENTESKSVDELSQDVARLFGRNVSYIVGGYMAGRIEDQLGREALVATVETGPIAFIRAYNSVAEEGMELHFVEPKDAAVSIFQDLRIAALEDDILRVHENLQTIQASPALQLDIEVEGYLIYNTGYILLKNGHLDLAKKAFQLDIALFPQVGATYVGLGDAYAQQGEIFAAIKAYEQALEMDTRQQWVAAIIRELENKERMKK